MIEKNELRLGNILNYQVYKTLKRGIVTSLGENKVCVDKTPLKYNSENVIPIELTEEWLVRFGFEMIERNHPFKGKNKHVFFNGQYWVNVDTEILYTYNCIGPDPNYYYINDHRIYIAKCGYVHSLQNLIYALTGEELTIKG